MQWWAWVAVGAILLGAELTVVNAQFYLVFVGAAALILGLAVLLGAALAVWLQWSLFTVLAVFFMVGFRRRIYRRMRAKLPLMKQGPAGQTVVLPAALAPGAVCRVELNGSTWNALNAGNTDIDAGVRARIERVDGLTLVVQAESPEPLRSC